MVAKCYLSQLFQFGGNTNTYNDFMCWRQSKDFYNPVIAFVQIPASRRAYQLSCAQS